MILNVENPVYNTFIVFSILMIILYVMKPDVVYDNKKNEFRQFGTTNGKTLLPIYVIGILLSIILYVLFHYIHIKFKTKKNEMYGGENSNYYCNDNDNKYYIQQIQTLQNQMNQMLQQQLNVNTNTIHRQLQDTMNTIKVNSIVPNALNI